eukprot:8406803-Ditylum_brightwellii.AAC.1
MHAAKDLTAALTGRDTNAPFAALGDEQLQVIWQIADIFKKLTHNKDDVQLPRVEKPPNQAVSQTENAPLLMVPTGTPVAKATNDTSSPRVQKNSGPHIIPLDDDSYGNLPPPKPHPISVPTPKGCSFYIPPEEDEISPVHHYSTRNRSKHQVNFLATVNEANINLLFFYTPKYYNHQPLATAVVDEDTGQLLEYRHLIKKKKYSKQWTNSFSNELGRFAQGLKRGIKGTDTVFFINKQE